MKNKLNVHVLITLVIFFFVMGVGLIVYNQRARLTMQTPALAECNVSGVTVNAPAGGGDLGCITSGAQIYRDDNRFTFSQMPSYLQNIAYVKTNNVPLKEQTSLNWSINLSQPATVYVMYRRISGQSAPSWLTSGYTKLSSSSTTDLSNYLVRQNTSGQKGLYDVYRRNDQATGTVSFGAASTSSQKAYSMYIVGVQIAGTQTTAPTNQPTSLPTQTPGGNAQYPADVLDLRSWKIQLPQLTNCSIDIFQPQLATYKHDSFFTLQDGGVRFRAPVNGVTTANSAYPRSELREMKYSGQYTSGCLPSSELASWSTTSGTHSMFVDLKVTKLPNSKPHLVIAQIHGGSDDLTVFRVEGNQLWVTNGDTAHGYLVDGNFQLNQRVTIGFEATGGQVRYYYNGNRVNYTLNSSSSTNYFKTGAYTQANCSNSSPCDATNYGETVVYKVTLNQAPSNQTVAPTPTPRASTTATPRPSTTNAPTATPGNGSATLPAQILNLANWKITLPLSGAPEIKQPALATYKLDPWFIVQDGGVRFRAAVNGGTTGGSSYPRSELREMTSNGSSNASWSSSSGKHTMTIDQMVTSLPKVKQHFVVGQIHDGGDDVTVFRVEGSQLWITNGNTTHGYLVDGNFALNRRFSVGFEVQNNVTKYYYNGNLVNYSLARSYSGAYFKAGAYTQANCSNSSPCDATNYGENIIYGLTVTHN